MQRKNREDISKRRLYSKGQPAKFLSYHPTTAVHLYLYISAPSGLVSAKFERDTEPTPEEIRKGSKGIGPILNHTAHSYKI